MEALAPSIRDLLADPTYERARELGRARVLAAADDPQGTRSLDELGVASKEERVLSFLYARLLVAAGPTAAPLRRWAVSEAKRGYGRLRTASVEELVEVARRLGYEFRAADGGVIVPLPDYLRLAAAIREAEFRLIRQPLREGKIRVSPDRAARVLQEGIRSLLAETLPLSAETREAFAAREGEFLGEIGRRIPLPVARAAEGIVALLPDRFPPCIRKMRRMLEEGENLSHAGRFALAAFLHQVGADFETIVDAYRGAPDFDEAITRYQVDHITHRDEGRGYSPPECETLRSHGLCFREGDPKAKSAVDRAPDRLCHETWLQHPLQYYRTKGGKVVEREPRRVTRKPTP